MATTGIWLRRQGVISVSADYDNLQLFASGWRMTLPTDAARTVSFHLLTGSVLQAAVGTQPASLWGDPDSFFLAGTTGINLLPPLEPTALPAGGNGGLPLP